MHKQTTRLALAAAVILIVLGGITFWPSGHGGQGQWWLGPPAAWGRDVLVRLDALKAVTCREQTVSVAADGVPHTSSTWQTLYVSCDSYRRDIYDVDVLREVQWYVPDGNDMVQHYVRFDLKCYGALRHTGSFGDDDPVERMRWFVERSDKAERVLAEEVIEGRRCVGFEIRAGKDRNDPEAWLDRIWFDVQTRLPARIERVSPPVPGGAMTTCTTIMDQFNYSIQLPADTFIPQLPPEGFVNAHPDDLPRQ